MSAATLPEKSEDGTGRASTATDPVAAPGAVHPPRRSVALARIARRTFDALSSDQARAVLQIRPDPVDAIRRSGPSPYRILCFGGGALRGVGLRDHNLGLPGHIADLLVEQTGRGAQIDVVVDADPTSPAALALLAGLRIRRYDAVIVVLGDGGAARVPVDRWRGAVVGLGRLLLDETSPAAGVFLYDSNRAVAAATSTHLSARTAAALARETAVTEEVCALSARLRFSELRPTLGSRNASGRFSDAAYRDWAGVIVQRLRTTIAELEVADDRDSPRAYRNRPQDERLRQRALDSLRLRPIGRDEVLDREVATALSMYRADGAALNLIDGDVQRPFAAAGIELGLSPRAHAFCAFAIESDELTLINDSRLNPRSAVSPLAQGPGALRFYAGFPVHTIDGYRIGMVCVLGTSPRSYRPRDLEGLRDVAARVERRLWNHVLRGSTDA